MHLLPGLQCRDGDALPELRRRTRDPAQATGEIAYSLIFTVSIASGNISNHMIVHEPYWAA
jgi:hypothetical protein